MEELIKAGIDKLPWQEMPWLAWLVLGTEDRETALLWFGLVFFLLGAVGNGGIIAQLGYLMEISPDDRRPAYSGYFNMLAAPAALLPMLGAVLVGAFSFTVLFACSLVAALLHFLAVLRLRAVTVESAEP